MKIAFDVHLGIGLNGTFAKRFRVELAQQHIHPEFVSRQLRNLRDIGECSEKQNKMQKNYRIANVSFSLPML